LHEACVLHNVAAGTGGIVPLLAGVFDVCPIGTLLFGTPLQGSKVLAQLK
jgi:hypothetical protein